MQAAVAPAVVQSLLFQGRSRVGQLGNQRPESTALDTSAERWDKAARARYRVTKTPPRAAFSTSPTAGTGTAGARQTRHRRRRRAPTVPPRATNSEPPTSHGRFEGCTYVLRRTGRGLRLFEDQGPERAAGRAVHPARGPGDHRHPAAQGRHRLGARGHVLRHGGVAHGPGLRHGRTAGAAGGLRDNNRPQQGRGLGPNDDPAVIPLPQTGSNDARPSPASSASTAESADHRSKDRIRRRKAILEFYGPGASELMCA